MEIKNYHKHRNEMTDEEIEAFAHYGFICKQILTETFFKELKQ